MKKHCVSDRSGAGADDEVQVLKLGRQRGHEWGGKWEGWLIEWSNDWMIECSNFGGEMKKKLKIKKNKKSSMCTDKKM